MKHMKHCPTHGPYTVEMLELAGKTIERRCPRCVTDFKAGQVQFAVSQEKQSREDRIRQLIGKSGLPRRYIQKYDFETFSSATPEQQYALQIAQQFAYGFEQALEHGSNLLFTGRSGTGKNHLATSIAKVIIEQGYSALFLTTINAMRSIKETFSQDSELTERQVIYRLVQDFDLLILDEVGIQFKSQTEGILLFDILNGRYEEMKPTILISNEDLGQLRQTLGERLIDRLLEDGTHVEFLWNSFRQANHGNLFNQRWGRN
ncbi:MAG: ATP-binding protein [Gammaproteobacteria bacterium]|nr:ATP-binding protein [Gammaproteobacteria bacterium]